VARPGLRNLSLFGFYGFPCIELEIEIVKLVRAGAISVAAEEDHRLSENIAGVVINTSWLFTLLRNPIPI